jgi:hypothetical protein
LAVSVATDFRENDNCYFTYRLPQRIHIVKFDKFPKDMKKYCFFSGRFDIQCGRPSICLAYIFSISFPKTTSDEVTTFAKNIPLRILKRCCYLLKRFKIRDAHPGLWLDGTFWNLSPELLHVKSTELARNIPYGVVGLRNELKYQNSTPAYDWLRHDLLLRNNCVSTHQTCQKCLRGSFRNVITWKSILNLS